MTNRDHAKSDSQTLTRSTEAIQALVERADYAAAEETITYLMEKFLPTMLGQVQALRQLKEGA